MKRKTHLLLFAILLSLVLLASAIAICLYRKEQGTSASLRDIEEKLTSTQAELLQMADNLSALKSERDAYQAELDELEAKLNGVSEDALLLEGEREELAEQIRLLRVSINEKNEEIASLTEDIENYNLVYSSDVRTQARVYKEIITALEQEAPLKRIAKLDKDGNPVDPPTQEIIREDETYYYVYPKIALFYEDIERGYSFSYQPNETFFSASVIKAPYILWLLGEISREEDIARTNAEALYAAQTEHSSSAAEGAAPETMPESAEITSASEHTTSPETIVESIETTSAPETTTAPEITSAEKTTQMPESTDSPQETTHPELVFDPEKEIYDLSRIFVYTEDKFREGSGIIQKQEFGTEYTYLELIELAIRKSDNVAFGELRNVFGYSGFYRYNRSLKIDSVRKNFNQITAADMAIYLRAMYTFIEEDENYGELLGEWLRGSAHTVLIPYAVYPTPTAHKYGWDIDAYHDAAIVYDEHPYTLVILTDLDEGGTEIDAYIRRVVKLVHQLHTQFYR